MSANAAPRCASGRLVDRHFTARITPAQESQLRAHLVDCDRCRGRYDRHLIYAELAPGRPGMTERLGAGLGVGRAQARPRSPASLRSAGLLTVAAAACVALLAIGHGRRAPDVEYGVRGSAAAEGGAAIEIYRVTPDGATRRASGWMSARDELAFAYRNPTGFSRLMLFGVDEAGDIHWFHPAWTDPRQDPLAVPIDTGVGPFELREAIRHAVRGRHLRIVALFSDAPLTVRALEDEWRAGRSDPSGSARIETVLEVRP